MVDAGQRIVTQVPADVVNAPGPGARVVCMARISWERMQGTVSVDRQDRWLGPSVMTSVGCSPRGLVLLKIPLSFTP